MSRTIFFSESRSLNPNWIFEILSCGQIEDKIYLQQSDFRVALNKITYILKGNFPQKNYFTRLRILALSFSFCDTTLLRTKNTNYPPVLRCLSEGKLLYKKVQICKQ